MALVVIVGGIAAVCMSSAILAAVIGILTAALVAIDMLAFSRPPAHEPVTREPTPDKLNVDLSRRP